MDGIISVLKPPGMTSHDVVSFLRRTLHMTRIGHTGTLDPGVAGVLPICLGKATRISEYMTKGIKAYRGIIKFGISTFSQDAFGEITFTSDASWLKEGIIKDCAEGFKGPLKQIPPMVSAVKVQGKKLCDLAREGKEINREPRDITIHNLDFIHFYHLGSAAPEAMFDVTCSKGTYIRTLCHDMGEKLGCGAHMSHLIRTASGPYKLEHSVTLEEILELAKAQRITEAILPMESALLSFPAVYAHKSAEKSVCNGAKLYPQGIERVDVDIPGGTLVRIKGSVGNLLAIGEAQIEENEAGQRIVYQPVKVLC